jgi:hypothetical protein
LIPAYPCFPDFDRLPAATYYVPLTDADALRDILSGFRSLSESALPAQVVGLSPVLNAPHTSTDTPSVASVRLSGGYEVTAFPTYHRVASQGYCVWRWQRSIRPEYAFEGEVCDIEKPAALIFAAAI